MSGSRLLQPLHMDLGFTVRTFAYGQMAVRASTVGLSRNPNKAPRFTY